MSDLNGVLVHYWGSRLTTSLSPATWFEPGMGACGVESGANDMVVAISAQIYDSGKHCHERMRVQCEYAITYRTLREWNL